MAEKRQGGRGSKLLNLLKQTKAGLGEDEGLPPSAVPDKPVGMFFYLNHEYFHCSICKNRFFNILVKNIF